MHHAADNVQYMQLTTRTCDMHHAADNVQYAICNISCTMQHATYIMQPTRGNRRQTCNVQRPEAPFLSVCYNTQQPKPCSH
jgi:hypothetical protein